MNKSRNGRASRLVYDTLALGMALAFFSAFAHHVYRFDFKPLAALGVPVLVVFFGFGSLLFIRGRSLAKGSAQFRSLFAAERAVQAAAWHLCGIVLGTVIYALLLRSGVTWDSEPWLIGIWVLLLLIPHALMQIGLLTFLGAVWIVAPQLFGRVGALEARHRVLQ
jgi:hypothetical protein